MVFQHARRLLEQLEQPGLGAVALRVVLDGPVDEAGVCVERIVVLVFERDLNVDPMPAARGGEPALALGVRRREYARERGNPPAFGKGLYVLFGSFEKVAVNDDRRFVEDVCHRDDVAGGSRLGRCGTRLEQRRVRCASHIQIDRVIFIQCNTAYTAQNVSYRVHKTQHSTFLSYF